MVRSLAFSLKSKQSHLVPAPYSISPDTYNSADSFRRCLPSTKRKLRFSLLFSYLSLSFRSYNFRQINKNKYSSICFASWFGGNLVSFFRPTIFFHSLVGRSRKWETGLNDSASLDTFHYFIFLVSFLLFALYFVFANFVCIRALVAQECNALCLAVYHSCVKSQG